nr:hypothetical protein [Escherichia coli]
MQIDALPVLLYTKLHPPTQTNQFITYVLHIAPNPILKHPGLHPSLPPANASRSKKIRLTALPCVLQNCTNRTQAVAGMQITTFSRTKPSLDKLI